MIDTVGGRLVQTCESLCEDIRERFDLTLFRIEFRRRPTPLVITLRPAWPHHTDPAEAILRRAVPATIEHAVVHDGRQIATVRVEHEHRAEFPAGSSEHLAAVLARYGPRFAQLLEAGQL